LNSTKGWRVHGPAALLAATDAMIEVITLMKGDPMKVWSSVEVASAIGKRKDTTRVLLWRMTQGKHARLVSKRGPGGGYTLK
jgi:hypothetical protein